jgi:putative ABC transport system substrate-binding protein
MNRRDTLLGLAALGAAPRIVLAQERTVRIGVLVGRRNSDFMPPILKRLGELGYVEGGNLAIDYRSTDGVLERFPPLARELIEAKCDVIFAIGAPQGAQALVEAKSPIPVVIIANDYDPVQSGIVTNLRRPGGNVTGVFLSQLELAAKRLEFMHAIVPAAVRYLVLGDAGTKDQLDATQQAARRLRVEIVAETFGSPPYDIEAAFAKIRALRVEALIVLTSPHLVDQRAKISELTMKHRLPASVGYQAADWGQAGFIIAYAAELAKMAARAADMAASILKGAKPGGIPIEQATNYELVINLRTAKALGITIPQSVLLRADRVIE